MARKKKSHRVLQRGAWVISKVDAYNKHLGWLPLIEVLGIIFLVLLKMRLFP